AVRKEYVAQAARDRFLRRDGDDAELAQQLRDASMRAEMNLRVVDASTYFRAQRLLLLIHRRDQRGEVVVLARVGARDVGCIAVELSAGIDQERMRPGRRGALLDLIMQHRGVFVQRDDVRI